MIRDDGSSRDLAALVVPLIGGIAETGDRYEPFRLVDGDGRVVAAAAEFFCDLQAAGRAASTVRSYGLDLLRWFRFLWAAGAGWDRATRAEARDFCRWRRSWRGSRREAGRAGPGRGAVLGGGAGARGDGAAGVL